MEPSATLGARLVSTVWDLSAGRIAHLDSEMMERSAISQRHTVEALVMPFGMKTTARETTQSSVARNGAPSGIPSAAQISTTLLAAYVPLIALQA